MSRPIRCQARYAGSPAEIFGTLVDGEYLRARLDHIGGSHAALLELTADETSARYVLRQGVSREHLPGPLRKFLPGDLLIQRTETWRRVAEDRFDGTVDATVKDAPGQITGTLRLAAAGPDTALFSLDGTATVKIPLIGGKIEEVIADHVATLVDKETRFTEEWLGRAQAR